MFIYKTISYSLNRALHRCVQITKHRISQTLHRHNHNFNKPKVVLGIETSCDDTGVAVVDTDGQILGEALHSQTEIHVE